MPSLSTLEAGDTPVEGLKLSTLDGPLRLPAIVFGAGAFSNQYNTDDHLASNTPLETVRLALRYGIHAFDTSAYYGPSEVVLGNALQAVKDEFPRASYQLMTKCGRFGVVNFDYSPTTIRESVTRSLSRLQTEYIDTVYLHDVEFVATPVLSKTTGNHATALKAEKEAYGLREGDEANVRGDGDQKILDAYAELRKLKDEGLVKHIGITGYPLPTLLRLALLILHTLPYKPVDAILSYSHLSLQNATFSDFATHFQQRAQVRQLLAASPLNLLAAVVKASSIWPEGLPNLAVGYSIQSTGAAHGNIPLVVGFSHPREVHECIRVWRELQNGHNDERKKNEAEAREVFRKAGYLDWSWASP